MSKVKKRGMFSAGPPLRPGGPLGEYTGNPEYYRTDPTAAEVLKTSPQQPGDPLEKRSRQYHSREMIPLEEQIKTVVKSVPVIPGRTLITPRLVGVAAVRLDAGLKDRQDIMIINASDVAVWIGNNSVVAANLGIPLAASSPAGSLNGGVFSGTIGEETEFWGLAAGGAANLVVVVETARE